MKKRTLSQSPIGTFAILTFPILALLAAVYFIFMNFSSCNQNNTGGIDFGLLSECTEIMLYFLKAYFVSWIIILLFLAWKSTFFNKKGIVFSIAILSLLLIWSAYPF